MTARLNLPADLAARVASGEQLVVPMEAVEAITVSEMFSRYDEGNPPDRSQSEWVAPEPGVYQVTDSQGVCGVCHTVPGAQTFVAHVVPTGDVFWTHGNRSEPWTLGTPKMDGSHIPAAIVRPDQRHPALDAAPYLGLIETDLSRTETKE